MKRTKHLLASLVCLCMVLMVSALIVSAALSGATLKLDAPEAGKALDTSPTVSLGRVDVKQTRWEGKLDGDKVIAGEDYTVYIDLTPKDNEVFKTDGTFAPTLNGDDPEIVSISAKSVQLKYTFYGCKSDFAPYEYGTARARHKLKVYTQTTPLVESGEVIRQGETIKVVRAYAEAGKIKGTHMIELGGKICYIEAFTKYHPEDLSVFDVKVEGKLDPNNIPAHLVPNANVAPPERKPQTLTTVSIRKFEAVAGQTPTVTPVNSSFYQISSIQYSADPVKTPYTWVTATVTFTPKHEEDSFAADVKVDNGGVIVSNTGKQLQVKYTAFATNGDSYSKVTQTMKDYNEDLSLRAAHREPYYYTGTPVAGHGELLAYQYPLMTGNTVVLPEEFPIVDLEVSKKLPGVTGIWYRVIINHGYYYVPEAYVASVKEYNNYWQGTPPAKMVLTPYEFAGGSGTMEDPYLVQTAEQFNSIRFGLDKHYKLIADIDLSKWGNWIPIGSTPAYGGDNGNPNRAHDGAGAFIGSLDGNGHVVSGMQIIINEETPYMTEKGNVRYYGLFSRVGTAPKEHTIRNLGVINYKISVKYTAVTERLDLYMGGIAGINACLDILDCYTAGGTVEFDLTAASETGMFFLHAGGICGEGGGLVWDRTYLHLERCFNTSDITVNVHRASGYNDDYIQASGIIAAIDNTHIYECWNSGDITIGIMKDGAWSDYVASGITAFSAIPDIPGIYHRPTDGASYILNCYNSGTITANSSSGVFGHSASDIHLRNCYNVGKLVKNDQGDAMGYSGQYILPYAAVVPYGTEFINNCYGNGTSVSGSQWKMSSALGRMILAAHPEDTFKIPAVKAVASNVGKFKDVKADAWYAEPVNWAVEKNITTGTSATTFSPDNTCTRAQILTFLWRAVGAPKATSANPFTDVKSADYFYDAALWAHSKGMVSGTNFAPNTPCTREATVVYLWKNAGTPTATAGSTFTDVPANADYAQAVAWAVSKGVTTGTSATTFSPATTCTRGQIVTFLYRALK